MGNLIAKRYVKALLLDRDIKRITTVYNNINIIATAYNENKFLSIIYSPYIKDSDKVSLINSFIKGDTTVDNLIQLLVHNKRLNILPNIANELKKEIHILTNSYEGVVLSKIKLKNADIVSIQKQFEKKFNTSLTLVQNICNYDGVKVNIEGLGVEISFSKNRLKLQMIKHILKAV
ncbi:ATP synthase delta chain [hydrothermal vent metagenome]|uniref:ATP synthase delta chain n=1 Tax=hydrothermal vent metagenome TaxID=652676 RepID=A0A3B1DRV5_9ZZZZ